MMGTKVKFKLVFVKALPHKCPQCTSTANWMTVGVEVKPNGKVEAVAVRCNGCGNYYVIPQKPVNTSTTPWHFDCNLNKIVQD